jgi:hypothetical protein
MAHCPGERPPPAGPPARRPPPCPSTPHLATVHPFTRQVDFAIEDVMPRLLAWGLAQPGGEPGTFRAVPLASARPLLMQVRPPAAGAARAATLPPPAARHSCCPPRR